MPDALSSAEPVLIVGSGIAGLSLALMLEEAGVRSTVLSKAQTGTAGSSWYAQGGLAAAIGEDDSVEEHIADTLAVACGLARPDAVERILGASQAACRWLLRQGVEFDRNPDGGFSLGMEGGHAHRRILHCRDATGRGIINALIERVRERSERIRLLEHRVAIDLCIDSDDRARGVYTLDLQSGEVELLRGACTVLASGGISGIYAHATSVSPAHGDGIAMAARVHLPLTNMEFVQFHPSALHGAKGVLLSEALRGEGAKLCDAEGVPFMHEYHEAADLAPRDAVSRAIGRHLERTGAECAYLDVRGLDVEFSRRRFPYLWEECARYGLSPDVDLLPAIPAAHYSCGGVHVDDRGQTQIPGLYAIGETAWSGLHGANRLASNSLTECVVMALLSCHNIVLSRLSAHSGRIPEEPPFRTVRRPPDAEVVESLKARSEAVRRSVTQHLGIVRRTDDLARAVREFSAERAAFERELPDLPLCPEALELRNLLTCAELVAISAHQRRECRGLHYVEDCTDEELMPVGADTKVRLTPVDLSG
ncbi:MAG: L-aspartate oxidase [Gammaproteobacteria bacterium AqS3]|nr:L-aspartate oxidase [Gammaproteobacteria bacterium AqS3]